MASFFRRMRWKFWSFLSRLHVKWYFLGLVLVVMVITIYSLTDPQRYNDGTSIDLSDRRQRELIEEYARKKKEEQNEVNQRDLEERNPVQRQMKEDALQGIIWGKVRGSRTFAPDLGLKKPEDDLEEMERQQRKKAQELLSPNSKYFHDINEKGYKDNDTIDSGGLQGGKGHCLVYVFPAMPEELYECQHLVVKPKTPICLYSSDEDIHVSKHIREEGIWEPHMVMEFQNKLFGDPDLGFIDIGANIGQYSLIAASMGHKVVAVEPYLPNIQRFHAAILMGNLQDKITIVRNAISDTRHSLELKLYKDNQGGVALTEDFADPWCEGLDCPAQTHTIYMDDLLEVTNFDKAIMKVDIEGHEHRAFVKSLRLLKEIYVPYIIMEWIKLRAFYGSEIHESPDKNLVFQMVDFFSHNDYHAYSMVSGAKLKTAYWYSWPDDIIWKHDLADMQ